MTRDSHKTTSAASLDSGASPDILRLGLEASGVAMAFRDLSMHLVYANPAFLAFYGCSLEELQALPLEDVLTEEVRPCLHSGKSWEGEHAIRSRKGVKLPVWSRFDPVCDESGKVVNIVSFMRDASGTKRLRNALDQTERHLNFLSDNTSDFLFRLRLADGQYDYVSPAVFNITGYKPQDLYDNRYLFRELTPEDWKETVDTWWKEFRNGKTRYNYTSPIHHKDGSLKWVSQRITMVNDVAGNPLAIEGIVTDVTEAKLAEEALRASEERHRLLVETLEDVIWTMDNELNYTYVSPAIETLTGFTPDEYMAMRLEETMTPESYETVQVKRAMRFDAESNGDTDYTNRLEIERWCRDGSTVWVESITRRLRDAEGNAVGYLGISRDISYRKEAELAIRTNENRYRSLFEDSPISLWEEDLTRLKAYFDELKEQGVTDFREFFYEHPDKLAHCATLVDVVAVNKATLELLRARSKEELLGNLDKVLTESSMAAFTEEMILLASGGCEYCGEITHRTLEGDNIWVVVHFLVPPEYQDSLSRVIVSLIDVTPRKRAEEALMESEERYRIVVENAQEGVVVIQDGLPVFANEAVEEILGYEMTELNDLRPQDLVHPEDQDVAKRWYAHFSAMGRTDAFTSVRIISKQGEVKWVTMSLKAITWGGRDAHLEILTDITPHKTLEKELRIAHAEMEDRVIKRTAELSETNVMLTAEVEEREKAQEQILSLTQQLIRIQEDERQRISRDLHDKVAQDLSSIVIRMETMFDGFAGVDNDLLSRGRDVTSIVRGAIAAVRDIAYGLRPPALDQLGLGQALERHCEVSARRSGVDIDFSAVGIEDTILDFDTEINIYRMVQEALNNVGKHAEASRASVRLVRSHPDLIVRISDNGCGFNVEDRGSEAFNECHMGLRSMEERARLLGGSAEIQSLIGSGTRVIFKIPIANSRRV